MRDDAAGKNTFAKFTSICAVGWVMRGEMHVHVHVHVYTLHEGGRMLHFLLKLIQENSLVMTQVPTAHKYLPGVIFNNHPTNGCPMSVKDFEPVPASRLRKPLPRRIGTHGG